MTPDQYGDKYQDHFLEQYKLCVQMAEAANQRRDQINRFFPTLFSGLVAILLIVPRLDQSATVSLPETAWNWLLIAIAAMGLYLSFSWFASILSQRRVLSAKFRIIAEMEEKLPFPAISKEWQEFRHYSTYYSSLTLLGRQYSDTFLPLVFVIPFYALLGYAIFQVVG